MAFGSEVQGGHGAGGSVIPHESSAHSVLVPDTELLFTAQFHRAGPDLVLTGRDGQHHLVPGYFSSEHHPALVAPNGAHLSPDTVDLLAGSATPGHYAQAQPTAPPDSIGKIEKVVGDVSVVRNGVTVALHVGDAVFKSDVVQTGASSSCGISFPDGTALNLVANTRMALNDYAFDANSNSNGALFTLVEGTFAFVAGKVAHQGDMKIATPVATMGIRGTTGVVQEQPDNAATITAQAAGHTYSFAVVPDIGTGITGMWDVFLTDANGIIQRDANGNPIVLATVSQSGYVTYLTPQGPGERPMVSVEPVSNSQYAFEQEMLQQLFQTLNPTNLNNNNNGGSSTTPPPFELPNPIPQLFEDSGKPFTINVPNGANPSAPTTPTFIDIVVGPTGPLTVVIWIATSPGKWSHGSNWLGGEQPTSPQEVEILVPIKVTADGNDSAAGLVIVGGATVNIISGATLTILDFIHGGGTIQLNSSGSDPTLAIDGAVSLVGGGIINMIGTPGEDNIVGVPGTHAVLINIDFTIEGTGTIGGGDGNLTFENFGTVNANDGLLTINTGNVVANNGLMEATLGGTLAFDDGVSNIGTIKADGAGSAVTFVSAAVTNLAGGTINATNAGTVTFEHGSVANAGTLEATNGGILQLEHLTVTNSAAGELSIDALSELDLMNATVSGGTDTNAGHVVVTKGASVLHGDSVTNTGTMTVEGAGASLTLEGDTTLLNDTGGHITATDGGLVTIELDTNSNVNSGIIQAFCGGEVDFSINVDGGSNYGLIEAGAGGKVHFFDTHHGGGDGSGPQGGNYGTMEAADGGVLIFDGGLDNFYRVEAVNGGTIDLNNGLKNHAGTVEAIGCDSVTTITINGDVINDAKIEATGFGAQINIANSVSSENAGTIIAENDGIITLSAVQLENDQGAKVEANGATINYTGGTVTNDGTFKSDHQGVIFFGSDAIVHNDGTGVFEALSDGTITFLDSTICNGVAVSGASGGTVEASCGGGVTFFGSTVYNGSSVSGTAGGTIQASSSGTVTFVESSIYNNNDADGPGGVIEALRGGTVAIDSSTVFNNNGTIEAVGCGAVVSLFGADIYGGTLASSDGGVIEATLEASLLEDVTILGGSVLQAVDNGFIGSFRLADTTTLAGGTVTFEGAGEFLLMGGDIVASTAGTMLKNASTIDGAGQIGAGDGKLTLDNQSCGVVDADLRDFTLTIDTGSTVENCGLLEATNCTTLSITDSVHNYAGAFIKADGGTVDLNGGYTNYGTIEATDCGVVNIDLIDGNGPNYGLIEALNGTINITITGYNFNHGTIEAGAGGTINFTRLDTISEPGAGNSGLIKAFDGGTITLSGSGSNSGTMEAIGCGSTITFALAKGDATQTNNGGTMEALCGGAIIVNGGTLNNDYSTTTDTAGTIEALRGGRVTVNGGTTNNSGGSIIEALSCGIVTFDDGATIHNSTRATIEALCGGTINLNGTTVYNRNGNIEADGIGAMVLLAGAAILGGTLETSAHGIIETVACSGDTTFDGVTIATGSAIQVDDHTTLTLQDTIDENATVTNDGTITLVKGCDPSLIVNGNITLAGSGTVVLNGDTDSIKGTGEGTDTLHNANTIEGAGQIGGANLVFINQSCGVVDADASGHTLVLDTGTAVTNLGTLEATHGGILEIDDNVCNIGGTIASYGCGSVVELEGVTIKGGMFLTDDSTSGDRGVIEVANTDAATVFDGGGGHAVSIGGFVHVVGGASLALIGTIDLAAHGQNGTIDVDVTHVTDGPDIGANLVIHGTVTLSGAGAVVMEGDAAKITAAAPGAELHNATTIAGAGSIGVGDNDLTVVNESCGTINANNASADNLTIATGCNTIVNHGLLEASGGGTLDIVSHVDNACGSLLATSGGVLDVQSCISGGTATIHGATLEFAAASNVNVTFDNGSVDSPTYGTLALNDPKDFSGTIANFTGTCPDANHSDTIDLAGFKACNTTLHASYNGDAGITTLCVVDTTDNLSATLKLSGPYATGNFTIASDGKGGIDIFDPPTTGATDAAATATPAPGNDHVAASASQNGTDHAVGPASEAGLGGDQGSAAAATAPDGAAASPVNQLALAGDTVTAPPSATSALGGSDLAAFGSDHVAVPPAGPVPGSTLSAGAIEVSTVTSPIPIAVELPGTPELDREHLTDWTIVNGSDNAAHDEGAPPTVPTASTNNEHTALPALATPPAPAPATSPTLASASLSGLGNDSFAFHSNLGSDTAQNTDAHTSELAHSNLQIAGPALAAIVPEFHQEFAFDAIHQDAANLSAAVDQFHQMASNSTLLH
jgi:hypothetical protein